MNKDLHDSLEDVLTGLEAGCSLEDALADHPELEAEFGVLLASLQATRQQAAEALPAAVLNRSRTRLLGRAMQLRQAPKPRPVGLRRTHRFAIALITVFFILLSGSGLAVGSAQALPGDQLYPVKRAAENLRLSLAVSRRDHQAVEDRYQARRIEEVRQLLTTGRSAFVQFIGRINRQQGKQWDIAGIQVHLQPETMLIGELLPGMEVEVEGLTVPQGWVRASEVHLQTFGFVGYVESIAADTWQISGRKVQITSQTRIDPRVQVGDWVVVSVTSDDFGILSASLIDISYLPTPTPASPASLKMTPDPDAGSAEEGMTADPQQDLDHDGEAESQDGGTGDDDHLGEQEDGSLGEEDDHPGEDELPDEEDHGSDEGEEEDHLDDKEGDKGDD